MKEEKEQGAEIDLWLIMSREIKTATPRVASLSNLKHQNQ
jgi:hypothetical protein